MALTFNHRGAYDIYDRQHGNADNPSSFIFFLSIERLLSPTLATASVSTTAVLPEDSS